MVDVVLPITYAASISTSGLTRRVGALGNNPSIDVATVPEDIWYGSTIGILNAIDHKLVQRLSAPTNLEVVSSSALDTAAGTGARIVQIRYLDAGWEQKVVNLTMNGTTPVALPEPCIRVNTFAVVTSGTFGGANIGNLSVRVAGGLGATISYMGATHGIDRSSLYTSANNSFFDMFAILISVNQVDVNLRGVNIDLCVSTNNGPILVPAQIGNTSTTPYRHEAAGLPLITLPARTDMWLRCTAVSNNNANVTASIAGIQRNALPFDM